MKVLISDFDDTLYVDDINILKKNIDICNKFMKENIFIIATGRNYNSIYKIIKKYNIKYNFLILLDGALVLDKDNNILDKTNLDIDIINKCINILKENNINYYLDDGFIKTDNFKEVLKIVIPKELNENKNIIDLFKNIDIFIYESSKHYNIVGSNVNKIYSIKKLLETKLINNNIYTIGDNENDYLMLKEYNSAIMKNHHKKIDELNLETYDNLYTYILELEKN